MLNVPAAAALDVAIKRWLIRKYELVGKDAEGRGIYRVAPKDWAEGDLDMVLAWETWFTSGESRKQDDLIVWLNCARDRGVDLTSLSSLLPKEPEQGVPWVKIAAGVGGAFFVHWLLKAPELPVPAAAQQPVTEQTMRELLAPVIGKTVHGG